MTTRHAGIMVEKVTIDLKTGKKENWFALCTSEPTLDTQKYSLTYEGYISAWTQDPFDIQNAI